SRRAVSVHNGPRRLAKPPEYITSAIDREAGRVQWAGYLRKGVVIICECRLVDELWISPSSRPGGRGARRSGRTGRRARRGTWRGRRGDRRTGRGGSRRGVRGRGLARLAGGLRSAGAMVIKKRLRSGTASSEDDDHRHNDQPDSALSARPGTGRRRAAGWRGRGGADRKGCGRLVVSMEGRRRLLARRLRRPGDVRAVRGCPGRRRSGAGRGRRRSRWREQERGRIACRTRTLLPQGRTAAAAE